MDDTEARSHLMRWVKLRLFISAPILLDYLCSICHHITIHLYVCVCVRAFVNVCVRACVYTTLIQRKHMHSLLYVSKKEI